MFTEETLKKDKRLKDEWEKKVKKMGAEGYTSRTVSGFEVNPVYSPRDMKDIADEDIPPSRRVSIHQGLLAYPPSTLPSYYRAADVTWQHQGDCGEN